MRYNPAKIEAKWQKRWIKDKTYEPNLKAAKKPFYNLMMFPYPSAEGLHIGAVRTFSGVDMYGRFKRMQGFNVFQPIGLDGFGIHSENYALKIGKHPIQHAKDSQKNFYRQLSMIGNGFAWDERLETYDPEYYKWTQWIFVRMFKKGLAYRAKAKVNWCSSCKTVLADEQVIAGECERCGTEVIKKDLEQWFFKITDYAERLLNNIEKLDWSERVKIAQKNWIGKSEGAELEFRIKNHESRIKVFTTRPDTLFGATYIVLAPEHELVQKLESRIKNQEEVKRYLKNAAKRSEVERAADTKEKTGVELVGVKAINPANQEEIPIWVADYVLAGYGTGAIMAVPAHDERDWEFAKKFNLPVRQVVRKPEAPIRSYLMGAKNIADKELEALGVKIAKTTIGGDRKIVIPACRLMEYERLIIGKMTPGFWNEYIGEEAIFIFKHKNGQTQRLVLSPETEAEINRLAAAFTDEALGRKSVWRWLAENDWYTNIIVHSQPGVLINSEKFSGLYSQDAKKKITESVSGKMQIHYHLRDWLISRQRYWGPPIPMIHCEKCGWQPVPEQDLPVKLPPVKDFRPQGKGKSPLASVRSFYETQCPKCEGKARRETDVSDAFLDSAWYFLRYPSTKDKKNPWNPVITRKWLPVDMYIGGAEHAVLHLLYSRFLTMVFHDWGLLHFGEPFVTFRAHGLITKDGAKMSKSKGNVVNPDEYIKAYGIDAIRMYLAFLAPFEQGGDFRDLGIAGVTRFLNRVWKFFERTADSVQRTARRDIEVSRTVHKTIKKVTEDIEALRYNTAISALMMMLNEFEAKPRAVSPADKKIFLKLLAPFAPHITEELWYAAGEKSSVHRSRWPEYDPKLIQENAFELVVQINGRVRGRVRVARDISETGARQAAESEKSLQKYFGEQPKRIVFVPNRLINYVF